MSWHGGSYIFEPVVRELIDSGASELMVAKVTRVLLEKLEDLDWADADGSIGLFDHPGVLEAANDLGYYTQDQIPSDGSYSTVRIRCGACKRRVHYRRKDDWDAVSEPHTVADGDERMCEGSGKNPYGY